MGEKRSKLEKEAWKHLKGTPTAYLATLEDDQPRVRPVALVVSNKRLWIASGTRNGKTRQIRRNPNVELCLPISAGGHQGYVRIAGTAHMILDPKTREALASEMEFFREYWESPDDVGYTLLEITPTEIEYLRPEEMEPSTLYL